MSTKAAAVAIMLALMTTLSAFQAASAETARSSPSPAVAGDPCPKLSLYGYRFGMGRSEALAVREVKPTAQDQFQFVAKPGITGTATFDQFGVLAGLKVDALPEAVSTLEADLRATLGQPSERLISTGSPTEHRDYKMLSWVNSPCGTVVHLIVNRNDGRVEGSNATFQQATVEGKVGR